ncbi:hypothetical protein [Sedimentitalea nanhaiensis]|uniref:hypothetical protein n=1 Tax=Sedimentitalea nanhaiensis TaxID=999627 RepID=UPI0004864C68|nr:hypothetical protein [Sedimentitalea nanhaiensis]
MARFDRLFPAHRPGAFLEMQGLGPVQSDLSVFFLALNRQDFPASFTCIASSCQRRRFVAPSQAMALSEDAKGYENFDDRIFRNFFLAANRGGTYTDHTVSYVSIHPVASPTRL